MILVFANRGDEAAATLAAALPRGRLVTPRDLARSGWKILTEAPERSTGIASGDPFAARDVHGVVVLLPAIVPQALDFIEADARTYVAQEMTAFLRYFLSVLACPALNQPTASSLSGPAWRLERWLQASRQVGVPAATMTRATFTPPSGDAADSSETIVEPTWIGDRILETELAHLTSACRAIAAAAKVGLVRLRFDLSCRGPEFAGAHPWPRLSGKRAAVLVDQYIHRKGHRH